MTAVQWRTYGLPALGACLLLALVAAVRDRWQLERDRRAFLRLFCVWFAAVVALSLAIVELSDPAGEWRDFWLFMVVTVLTLSVPVAVGWHDNRPITFRSFLQAFSACGGGSLLVLGAFWLHAHYGWWTVPISVAVLAAPAALYFHGDAPRTIAGLGRTYVYTTGGIVLLLLLISLLNFVGLE